MIGSLKGQLTHRDPDRVLVETPGGVGYEVLVAPRTLMDLPELGQELSLRVHTQVTETSITLYGFITDADRRLFRVVQTVKGVGPKLALAVTGTTDPESLAQAIAREDIAGLSKIPGLGKKTAERMCLELRDKLGALVAGGSAAGSALLVSSDNSDSPAVSDARAALAALGYNAKEIKKALAAASPGPDDTVQSLLRRALKSLSPA